MIALVVATVVEFVAVAVVVEAGRQSVDGDLLRLVVVAAVAVVVVVQVWEPQNYRSVLSRAMMLAVGLWAVGTCQQMSMAKLMMA